MGSLIQIGGGADGEIKDSLNFAFNDANIKHVRSVVKNEDLLDDDHHLHRIAYRLAAYPVRNYGTDPAKGKWFFFLKNILPAAMHNGVSTTLSIKKILSFAMKNSSNNVKRVVFDAVQGPDNSPHYVEGGNPTQDPQIAALVDQANTLMIRLICPAPLNDNDVVSTPNQNSDLDRNQHGHIIEKPPIKIFTPRPAAAVLPKAPKGTKKKKGGTKKKKGQPKKKAKARAKRK
jgi:hypothetical protein